MRIRRVKSLGLLAVAFVLPSCQSGNNASGGAEGVAAGMRQACIGRMTAESNMQPADIQETSSSDNPEGTMTVNLRAARGDQARCIVDRNFNVLSFDFL
ncbi:MAG: hypothetical protein ABWY13_00030 [Mesorhizobium sp.]|jgi:hypothetical protein|nr:hypothetical protein [Mesorhizobium sp.]